MKRDHNAVRINCIARIIWPGTIIGLFLCSLYALHDMQTAEGIGLFFSLKLGLENRIYLDLLVDVLGMICLALMIWFPCRVLNRRTGASYGRLLIGYLAVVPSLSLSTVLHMFHRDIVFLWDGQIGSEIIKSFCESAVFLQIWLPVLIILYAIRRTDFGKWHRIVWLLLGLLLVVSLVVPAVTHLISYLMGYLGLLLAFDCWETILFENEKLRKWSWILFVLLLLRGIYRIVILVSLV